MTGNGLGKSVEAVVDSIGKIGRSREHQGHENNLRQAIIPNVTGECRPAVVMGGRCPVQWATTGTRIRVVSFRTGGV